MNITVITAIYDLDRQNWDKVPEANYAPNPTFFCRPLTGDGSYFSSFEVMLRLKNDIVLISDISLKPILDPYLKVKSNLKIIYRDIFKLFKEELNIISRIQNLSSFKSMQTFPGNPQIWNARYVLLNYLKPWFLLEASKEVEFKENVAWLDFGYFKGNNGIDINKTFDWEYNFSDKIHFFQEMSVAEPWTGLINTIKSNHVFIAGRCFVLKKNKIEKYWQIIQEIFYELANIDLTDQDQTLMFLATRKYPELFEIHQHLGTEKFHITEYSKHRPS